MSFFGKKSTFTAISNIYNQLIVYTAVSIHLPWTIVLLTTIWGIPRRQLVARLTTEENLQIHLLSEHPNKALRIIFQTKEFEPGSVSLDLICTSLNRVCAYLHLTLLPPAGTHVITMVEAILGNVNHLSKTESLHNSCTCSYEVTPKNLAR